MLFLTLPRGYGKQAGAVLALPGSAADSQAPAGSPLGRAVVSGPVMPTPKFGPWVF